MPRLNGEEYVPGPAVPEGAKPMDEVFVVRASGEGVKSYEDYLSKSNLYRRRDWQNAVTGKGQLTYEEALRDEEKTLAQLAKVRFSGRSGEWDQSNQKAHPSCMRKFCKERPALLSALELAFTP
jgi:hypothetical protein